MTALKDQLKFQNTFRNLPAIFFEDVEPTPIKNPKLMSVSEKCLGLFDLDIKNLNKQEFTSWLNGTLQLPGEQRISTRYAGHQFGQWAGQLGDGRAISLGEIVNSRNQRWEIQTKGSGLTPFSRMGDGKAVIRSSVREYLCSEAMAALQVPTTRALALLVGDDEVQREQIERSGIVARVFPTNIRFGHFEYAFHFREKDALKALISYTNEEFFKGLTIEEMLRQIILSTADLVAQWQGVGFNHGVMNTDNMSVLGVTIDYGPFGFMEDTQLNHVCNHSDHSGRYAYFRQPGIAFWNLEKLLICFLDVVKKEKLEELLSIFPDHFQETWKNIFLNKLGLTADPNISVESYEEFITDLLRGMHELQVDFTFFFRSLCYYEIGKLESLGEFNKIYSLNDSLKKWFSKYDEFLQKSELPNPLRSDKMLKVNPKFVLRNYIAQEVIADVEKNNSETLEAWMQVLSSPFDEHEAFAEYAKPTPMQHKNIEVSCSS